MDNIYEKIEQIEKDIQLLKLEIQKLNDYFEYYKFSIPFLTLVIGILIGIITRFWI